MNENEVVCQITDLSSRNVRERDVVIDGVVKRIPFEYESGISPNVAIHPIGDGKAIPPATAEPPTGAIGCSGIGECEPAAVSVGQSRGYTDDPFVVSLAGQIREHGSVDKVLVDLLWSLARDVPLEFNPIIDQAMRYFVDQYPDQEAVA